MMRKRVWVVPMPIPFLGPFESLPPRRTNGRAKGMPRPRFLAGPRNDSNKGPWDDRGEKGLGMTGKRGLVGR